MDCSKFKWIAMVYPDTLIGVVKCKDVLLCSHEFKEIFIKWRHFATMAHVSPRATPLSYSIPCCSV